MKIAIVGAGIAGLAAARRLYKEHEITVYEGAAHPGGHSRTVTLDLDGSRVKVDTGFIVFNKHNYPRLTRLFEELGVSTRPTSMSFGVSAEGGRVEWSSNSPAAFFADPRHLVHPPFLAMLADIVRFNRRARRDLHSGALRGHTLGSYLARRNLGRRFREHYLVPMGAAIWCLPGGDILDAPAEAFLGFFDNHGLLGRRRHQWRTVEEGSSRYVERLIAPFRTCLRLGCPAVAVRRSGTHVTVVDGAAEASRFDHVVLACHSDTALSLLERADADERRVLGALRYVANDVHLHRDKALMPRRRAAWSSWNVVIPSRAGMGTPLGVTYWMNRLQGIEATSDLFVSVNPPVPPREALTFDAFRMDHPRMDWRSLAARRALAAIQGRGRVWYCGAYTGSGFHEDGLISGERAADSIETLAAARRPALREAARMSS